MHSVVGAGYGGTCEIAKEAAGRSPPPRPAAFASSGAPYAATENVLEIPGAPLDQG